MREEFQLIVDSLQMSWYQLAAFLPRLLAVLILLIAGWMLARGAQWLVIRTLRFIRVDSAAEQTGVDDFLVRGGVRFTVVTLLGRMVYWAVLLIFAIAAFNVIGFTMGPELVDRLTGFVPSVLAALIVLVIGSLGARFIRGLVEAYLNNVGVSEATNIGMLVQGALLAFVAVLALEQLGMAINLLALAFQLAFGGLCLALALAFGLGGRTWAESILERRRKNR